MREIRIGRCDPSILQDVRSAAHGLFGRHEGTCGLSSFVKIPQPLISADSVELGSTVENLVDVMVRMVLDAHVSLSKAPVAGRMEG